MYPFFELIKALPLLQQHPFTLLDVGCKGGMHDLCALFAPNLNAHGFELTLDEVNRLNLSSDKPVGAHIHHIKCVGPDWDMGTGASEVTSDFFNRTTAHHISTKMGLYTPVTEPQKPPEKTLDVFVHENTLPYVDFIKTDTDGFDFSIIKGAEKTIGNTVLGLQVECAINGNQSEHANLFRNIDRFLQAKGFSLFDMRLFRYSRAVMPLPFETPDPSQTIDGQISWCDAFYFRDLGRPDYEQRFGFVPEVHQILKLASLFELFKLPDCAAEVIIKYQDTIGAYIKNETALDNLTPRSMGKMSYKEYTGVYEHMTGMGKIYPFGRIKIRE